MYCDAIGSMIEETGIKQIVSLFAINGSEKQTKTYKIKHLQTPTTNKSPLSIAKLED
jgi:hypothetical protein